MHSKLNCVQLSWDFNCHILCTVYTASTITITLYFVAIYDLIYHRIYI